MKYETVIGIEIHAELDSKTKCFCDCKNEFKADVNTNVCPVCLGLPGAIPTLNEKAVKYVIMSGLAFSSNINEIGIMERKNYYYPDLSKGYQISQLEKAFCEKGEVHYILNGEEKVLRLNNIHLEEDAGKNIHDEINMKSYIDFNRAGVPLMEIVTEPDLRSGQEVTAALSNIAQTLSYLGVSDCRMDKGSFRCDVNISLRPVGSSTYGTRTEMKNLNSYKAIERAISYEVSRQTQLLEKGEKIIQETRKWDDNKNENFSLRSKEEANDYKYFKEPDLLNVKISDEYINSIKNEMPMLPNELRKLLLEKYSLPEFDTDILLSKKCIANYFLECVKLLDTPKAISNWILSDVLRLMKDNTIDEDAINVNEKTLVEIISLVNDGKLSTMAGKTLFEHIWKNESKENTLKLAESLGLIQNSNSDDIKKIIDVVLKENEVAVNDYLSGNEKVLAYLVGKVMKESRGKANPTLVNELLITELKAK